MPDNPAAQQKSRHQSPSLLSLITLMLRPIMMLPSLLAYLFYLHLSCLIRNHMITPPRTVEDVASSTIAQAPPGATSMSLVALSISVTRLLPLSGGVGVNNDDNNEAQSALSYGLANGLTLSTSTSKLHNSELHLSILDVRTSPLYIRRKAYPEWKAVNNNACSCCQWAVTLILCISMSPMLALDKQWKGEREKQNKDGRLVGAFRSKASLVG
jgi:hypothetical protein